MVHNIVITDDVWDELKPPCVTEKGFLKIYIIFYKHVAEFH